MKRNTRGLNRVKKRKHKITREFVRDETFYYLSHGGKITYLKANTESFIVSAAPGDQVAVDEFLNGN